MSHFTRLKTQMVELEYILRALTDLGYEHEVGRQEVRGHGGARTAVEVRVRTSWRGCDIGFRRAGETYDIVADWYGVKGVSRKDFTRQVTRRYAYHAAREKLQAQGFEVVEEQEEKGGRVHLLLRRMA